MLVRGIRIIRETRRRRIVAEPPGSEAHPWAPTRRGHNVRFHFSSKAMRNLVAHCEGQAHCGLEALGFLSGGVFSWKGKTYSVIRDALTAPLEATAVHVRFERTGFPGLFRQLDGLDYEYIMVGWYHSHPGYGCFMSDTDQQTQMSGFSEQFHVALVVDPVKKEIRAFRMARKRKVSTGGGITVPFEEVPFGVFSDEDWPWPGPRRKKI